MLECFMPCRFCRTSNGKDLVGKINQLGIGILLISNELGHSWPIGSSKKIMSDMIPWGP
jgi:hypothetical protein